MIPLPIAIKNRPRISEQKINPSERILDSFTECVVIKPMSYDYETEFIFLQFTMELSVADVIEVFQEEAFPKDCDEVLLERGS
jgi:hypothetical protein